MKKIIIRFIKSTKLTLTEVIKQEYAVNELEFENKLHDSINCLEQFLKENGRNLELLKQSNNYLAMQVEVNPRYPFTRNCDYLIGTINIITIQ